MASISIDNVDGFNSVHIVITRQHSIAVTEENRSNKLVIAYFLTASGNYCESCC